MQLAAPVVWMPRTAYEQCAREADRFYPRETGGTFMGYWASAGREVVITRVIAAGPGAKHALAAFEPDQQWQLREIAEHYSSSGRRDGYLGDWHSHPDAHSGELSGTDRSVLRRIIRTPKARAPHPISLVLWGTAANWRASTWIAALSGRALLPGRLLIVPASLRLYADSERMTEDRT